MLATGDYASAVRLRTTRLLLVVFALQFAFVGSACSSPEDEATRLVERAWEARVSGDRDAFARLVVADDVPHIEEAGAVLNLGKVDAMTKKALREKLDVEAKEVRAAPERVEVDARVVWWPPGARNESVENHTYVAVKTPDGWRLDFDLESRAKIARAVGQARGAIRDGNPELASKLLAEITDDDLDIPERAMLAGAIEATEESVDSADVLAKLREVMKAHHETEDPAERANLVAKARELGIEEYRLPPDVETLWEEAKKGDANAEFVAELSEKIRVEPNAVKEGHGARIELAVSNDNDRPVAGLAFVVDLVDEDGMRVHRLTQEWAGPLQPGATTETVVTAPSVPPSWDGATNVRLERVQLAVP